ncbi:hypothetical protein PCANC_19888 [Puccinia coronata f. sp. avenae]|uniref:Uncharacterized protein n=1 Tax=Puccinia coronata f. sp. avenae TaxID=200324 RepID=A0A2N5TQ36_9BASI|nr:hypothetical protein PCANC_19888 [Puccinia coronata f. sp. avenae]
MGDPVIPGIGAGYAGSGSRASDIRTRPTGSQPYTAGAPQRSQIVEVQVHRTFLGNTRPDVSGWVYGKRF